MLAQLRLQNFRCFDDHVVPIRDCTVIVGKNNAGKSTLVDALRLVSIASARFFTLALKQPVNWGSVRVPLREFGIAPSIEGMEFNTENLFHRNQDPPAIIEATFVSGATLRIYLVGPAKSCSRRSSECCHDWTAFDSSRGSDAVGEMRGPHRM